MSNLAKLLQPTTYKSKIKLYCPLKKLESSNLIKKHSDLLAQEDRKKYICISEIK